MTRIERDFTEAAPIVTCCKCGKNHEGFTPTQAGGCAADVQADRIVGHYGSAVADLTVFAFRQGLPEGLIVGTQVCDDCLEELIEAEAIFESQDFSWM